MKRSCLSIHPSLIGLVFIACLQPVGLADAQDQPAKRTAEVAVTVLDEKIYRHAVSAAIVAQNREKLSAKDFARWQSESRWRPYVSKVSYHVMSDWANRNGVSPTRDEIRQQLMKQLEQFPQLTETEDRAKKAKFAMELTTVVGLEWATAKALHEKYGGRIALSSFGGWISIEGRNALLKEYAEAGKIRFHDPEIERVFWVGVKSPAVLDVTVSDSKRIANDFARPPWEGWAARMVKLLEQQDKIRKASAPEPVAAGRDG